MANPKLQQRFQMQSKFGPGGGPTTIYSQIPTSEVEDSATKQTFRQKYFGGVKKALRFFTIVAIIILIINIAWLLDARSRYGIKDGFGILKHGKCDSIKSSDTWLHLAINVMSTLLLTGSNTFMAVFSCPSRKEVDKAHARGKFLRVGTLSLGNIGSIAWRKGLVVLIIGASSVPFHLMYNSLIFSTLAANEYYWTATTEGFLTGADFNLTNWESRYFQVTPPNIAANNGESTYEYFKNMQTSAPSWEKLSNKECVKTYSNMFLSSRRNVILVSSAKNDTNSVLLYGSTDIVSGILGGGGAGDANWWICSSGGQDGGNMMCNPNGHVTSSGAFSLWEYPIEYCLSEKVEDTCSLNFSQDIMYVMLAFNALKVAMMILVLFQYDAEIILASVGDAIASFMTYEDQSTRMMCLANRREMKRFWRSRGMARTFSQQRRRWGVAVSKKRWAFFLFFTLFSLCIVAFFGLWGFVHLKNRGIGLDPSSLWQIGFGQANQNTLVLYDNMRDRDAITMAIIANIPQILLAIGYLLYLGIMTTMFLASDFSNFAFKPQNLMVSTARGKQRGTWMFGAPMGWGITFVIFGTLFHWLVSQSIFVVKFQVYFKDGTAATPTEDSLDYSHLTNAGYSPIAIIFSIIAAGLMLLSSFIFMFRRFPGGAPPVVSTCTAAISAACHPSNRYPGIVFGKFRWGANGGFENGVGHCSLVPAQAWDLRQAGPSTEGWSYAGFPESQSL